VCTSSAANLDAAFARIVVPEPSLARIQSTIAMLKNDLELVE